MQAPPVRIAAASTAFSRATPQGPRARQVRGSDERDQDKVGIDHRSERAHLARGADPRLDDREAVTGRIQAAERERDTDVVV